MTLLKFGETIVNADLICAVEPLLPPPSHNPTHPAQPAIGITIHFGGSKVEIRDPKAMNAIATWAKATNHAITVVI
jgi:hypothetical protein